MSKEKNQEWKHSSVTIQAPGNGVEIIDLVRTSFKPGCHIKKVSKTEYMRGTYRADGSFICDGDVYTVQSKEAPMRNRRSLRQIFRTLRQLIATNFAGGDSELFVTLTYADQHNDPERIYSDLDKFWKRLKYKYAGLKYIAIVEPHASGNFHIHMLLSDTSGKPLYIPYEDLNDIWGLGMTEIDRLDDIDHMGAYFIAYFTNMELSPDEVKIYAAQDDVEYKNGKAYIKGKRLDYYPEHMRIYRHSLNCDTPRKESDIDAEIALIGAKNTFEHTTQFEDNGNTYEIYTAQFKKSTDNC